MYPPEILIPIFTVKKTLTGKTCHYLKVSREKDLTAYIHICTVIPIIQYSDLRTDAESSNTNTKLDEPCQHFARCIQHVKTDKRGKLNTLTIVIILASCSVKFPTPEFIAPTYYFYIMEKQSNTYKTE